MRPTDLKFRSPKEKTPDPYDTFVTANGVQLFQGKLRRKSSFSTANRFFEVKSDKIGFWRGPGSYDLSYQCIGKKKPKGGHVYKPLYRAKPNNAYYYIGDQIVYDPAFGTNRNKESDKSMYAVDASFSTKTRNLPKSKLYSPGIKRFMTPQPR